MAESYIPVNTNIICTNQTIPSPLFIWQQRENAVTVHDVKNEVLLNKDDRRISASFECVVPGMFWGGLQTLLLGIAIGALAALAIVATVATGGLAAIVLGVALVACVGSIGCGIGAIVAINAACKTAESSQWKFYHPDVFIEDKEALLNMSFLKCNKGGIVNLIMNHETAQTAALAISDHNMKQFYAQLGSQFFMGAIGAFFSGGGVGLIISSVLAIPGYFWGENCWNEEGMDDDSKKNDISGGVGENVFQDFVMESIETVADPDVLKNTGRLAQGMAIYGRGAVTGSVSDSFEGAIRTAISQKALKEVFSWKNMKGSVISFAANMVIGIGSDIYENIQEDMAIEASKTADDDDAGNTINVIAIDAPAKI
jgi:hypothetical protein